MVAPSFYFNGSFYFLFYNTICYDNGLERCNDGSVETFIFIAGEFIIAIRSNDVVSN